MANETFGTRLARLRKEKGLSQVDIADKVGVTAQAVSKWENDQTSPDIDVLLKLSEIFEISMDELLGKTEKKTVEMKEKPSKKDIGNMFLRIRVQSTDGDNVNVNLPLALVKLFVNKESGKLHFVSGNKALENIDFRQIIELVEQGIVGEIVSVDTADGDRVSIIVE